MEYDKKSVNGDAGEYLVAHKFTRLFGWPCRLYGVDLGVDAETEVMNDEGSSTGDIIKIQIKTFETISGAEVANVYVGDRHINYWKRFYLPVIVCCVDLSQEKVYWKQITSTEAYASGGMSRRISYCLTRDVLNVSARDSLKRLVAPESSKKIDDLFRQLDRIAQRLPATTTGYADFESIDETKALCAEVMDIIGKIEVLIAHYPWRVSSIDLRKLNTLRSHVRATRNNCSWPLTDLAEGG